MDDMTVPADRIDVAIPLDTRNAAVVRVVAAALGADAGYSLDEIDDFRLALNEAFALLVDASAAPARAEITFEPSPGHLVATLRRSDDVPPAAPDALAAGILHAVVDEYAVAGTSIVLRKRAAELTAS